jgi:hypothetical protein
MFGVPLCGSAQVYDDNHGVVKNSSIPESVLSKEDNAINYREVWEAVAAGEMEEHKEDTKTNLADLFMKVLPRQRELLGLILYNLKFPGFQPVFVVGTSCATLSCGLTNKQVMGSTLNKHLFADVVALRVCLSTLSDDFFQILLHSSCCCAFVGVSDLHSLKHVFCSLCFRHLVKTRLNVVDDRRDHYGVDVQNLHVVNVPSDGTLLAVDFAVGHARVVGV